jgi:hypothetical protein
MLLVCDAENGSVTSSHTETIVVPYNNNSLPEQDISFPWVALPGQLSLLAVSLRYFTAAGVMENEKWMTGMVVEGWG